MGVQGKFTYFCFLLILTTGFCCQLTEVKKDWWESAVFYQIYPRSFKDSNGDGIGDLNGIISKLDYLKDIGVTATWLSPIYQSPMVDFGYDISNFTDIHEIFGTMADFEKLIARAKTLGIKVILDFVPNHSSDKCEWFQKSIDKEEGYEDFYIWHDGIVDPNDPDNRLPPSNWLQAFRGSAWEWNDKRQQYYLHQFDAKQPDLNYRNPTVVATMKNVLKFWLDKGVDGFRVDAVPWLFEVKPDTDGNYPDEPKSNLTSDLNEAAYLKHIYTQDQPETVDMVYQWRKLLDDYKKEHGGDTRVLLTETYSDLKYVMQFYGNSKKNGAQVPFNFNFITRANNKSDAHGLYNAISLFITQMPKGRVPNWVMGNHDQRRVGSRYGEMRIDTMNMINLILPGVSITYMGEEIGMLDGEISWKDTRDPAACHSNESIYEKFTRDPARTPFQWDSSTSAGFSTNETTWLPVSKNYEKINVKTELASTKSHLKVYKQLVQLHKTDTLQYGLLRCSAVNSNTLVIVRELTGKTTYVMVANIGDEEENVDISNVSVLPATFRYKILSVNSARTVGSTVKTSQVNLKPYESFILESM